MKGWPARQSCKGSGRGRQPKCPCFWLSQKLECSRPGRPAADFPRHRGGPQARAGADRALENQARRTPRSDTRAMAGLMTLLTSLPAALWPIERVRMLYSLRWQTKLAFKTLKSTCQMRRPPCTTEPMARLQILASLAVALLAQHLSNTLQGGFPPQPDKRQSPLCQRRITALCWRAIIGIVRGNVSKTLKSTQRRQIPGGFHDTPGKRKNQPEECKSS